MPNEVLKIYKILQKSFGQQNWWPTTPDGKIFPEYLNIKKHSPQQKWEIITGAILTQNTSWKNVEKAIANLNRVNFFQNPFRFTRSEIEKMIQPSGFYRQKTRYLKGFIDYIKLKYNKNLIRFLETPKDDLRTELLQLKGIGPETADSIILYAAMLPVFVVDAYTIRIAKRVGICSSNKYEDVQRCFENKLTARQQAVERQKLFSEYHALLVRLGKDYCKKTAPLCQKCPLSNICKKFNSVNEITG